ncbi:MAG: 4Fe-4S dicluster domain-containing protein [Clostridiales bacterium]|nr:4Fe-4S dicluster domain-containing protein [Clostridiales bacterium]
MEKRQLGKTALWVTPAGFGALPIGPCQMDLPLAEGAEVLRYALERGINFIDTAQYYHTYPYIREALKGLPFDPVISSKSLETGFEEMNAAIEEARKALNRDVLDIFLLHEVRAGSDWKDRQGAWEALQEAKAKGIVKAIGFSTHHVDVAEKAAQIPELDILFPLINFKGLGIRHGDGPGTPEDMAKAIKGAADAGKGVFSMKVFGGGNLTPDYVKALDYVQGLPGIASMMIGFGHKYEVDHLFDYFAGKLHSGFTPPVNHKKIRVSQSDCLGCGACLKRCPNHAIAWNHNGLAEIDERICLTCGYCAPVCPAMAIIRY